ncbi:MAG: hypothetical protein IJB99_02310, partial [Clostridia bacterium]|nr:hypothetical protein [Clostridia bacterium]
VITNDAHKGELPLYEIDRRKKKRKNLDCSWTMHLPSGKAVKGLFDWRDIPEISVYSGEVEYSADITILNEAKKRTLDLGLVYEKARLYVNGKEAGVRIAPPYAFDITGYMKKGKNDIRVIVTNSLVSKYEKRAWISGMLGKTVLTTFE